jgi:hypothetical protein
LIVILSGAERVRLFVAYKDRTLQAAELCLEAALKSFINFQAVGQTRDLEGAGGRFD